jgi:hypothetical protein
MCIKSNLKKHFFFQDFFALFAYVQSQAVLCIGLIAASETDDIESLFTKKVIYDLTIKIQAEMIKIPSFHHLVKSYSSTQSRILQLISDKIENKVSSDIAEIQSASVNFATKTLNLVSMSQMFEESLINCNDNSLMDQLERIGTQLLICNDEHCRLGVLLQKFLNRETDVKVCVQENEIVELVKANENIKIVDDAETKIEDEFFYADLMNEIEPPLNAICALGENFDEEELQIQLTKKCFKPVLQQLKERIEVIDEGMKEREKKILKEKGINIKFEDFEKTDVEFLTQENMKKRSNKYNENREFLEKKQLFNLYPVTPHVPFKFNSTELEEEILE